MSDGVSKARSDDSGSLKHTGLSYMVYNPETDFIYPPIPKQSSKSDRGFNHPQTCYYLCPRRLLTDLLFDEDDHPEGTPDPRRVFSAYTIVTITHIIAALKLALLMDQSMSLLTTSRHSFTRIPGTRRTIQTSRMCFVTRLTRLTTVFYEVTLSYGYVIYCLLIPY